MWTLLRWHVDFARCWWQLAFPHTTPDQVKNPCTPGAKAQRDYLVIAATETDTLVGALLGMFALGSHCDLQHLTSDVAGLPTQCTNTPNPHSPISPFHHNSFKYWNACKFFKICTIAWTSVKFWSNPFEFDEIWKCRWTSFTSVKCCQNR